ncbi:MAG: 30S ribosome-binding factor RbfA [Tissierellia bacterium]|nr:30S ribosome-binding factor RbfA [Tissierellia bacterium]
MDNKRTRRIAKELQKEISAILATEIKDPRINSLISVTDVDLTKDLEQAKVYISSLGDEEDKEDILEGLRNASGFIKRELGIRLKLRNIPDLIFKTDDSIERGIYMDNLISKVLKEDEEKRKKYGNDE